MSASRFIYLHRSLMSKLLKADISDWILLMSGHPEFCLAKAMGISWEAQAEMHLEWTEG